jgi:ribonuclease VapC
VGAGGKQFVLDASALLAVLLNEPGQERVRAVVDHSFIHAINLTEVMARLLRMGVPLDEVRVSIDELHPRTERFFGHSQIELCATLIAGTRNLGLSLGDCVCLAAAIESGAVAVTADRCWKELDGKTFNGDTLRVELIR